LTNGSSFEDTNIKKTLKSHEIKMGKSFRIGESNTYQPSQIDVTDEDFLKKLTPELSNKIRETLSLAEEKAENIISNAVAQAETLKQQAQEQGFQEGLPKGQNQGYQDGYNKAINDVIEKAISLDKFISKITDAKYQIYHSNEDELIEFVMLLAEKLAHTQIIFDKEAIKNIIIEASSELREKENIKILIHPTLAKKIYSISDEIKDAVYGLKNLKIVEDRTISPDGAVIESHDSRVDARLSAQVELLFAKMMQEKQEKPILEDKFLDDSLNDKL
jgi:flagellar biosynthesis/type III secretory pathway protein FliH